MPLSCWNAAFPQQVMTLLSLFSVDSSKRPHWSFVGTDIALLRLSGLLEVKRLGRSFMGQPRQGCTFKNKTPQLGPVENSPEQSVIPLLIVEAPVLWSFICICGVQHMHSVSANTLWDVPKSTWEATFKRSSSEHMYCKVNRKSTRFHAFKWARHFVLWVELLWGLQGIPK